MDCCTYSIDDFIRNLWQNTDIQALVGTFEGLPAVGNIFSETPSQCFISICELSQPFYKRSSDGCILWVYLDIDVKIAVEEKCTSREQMRKKYAELQCILINYCDSDVAKVVYKDSSPVMYMDKRPYIAATFRIYFS